MSSNRRALERAAQALARERHRRHSTSSFFFFKATEKINSVVETHFGCPSSRLPSLSFLSLRLSRCVQRQRLHARSVQS